MDARASIPPTLPRPNPTVSYWQDPPDGIADLRTTEQLPETAGIVVIGSGISGASIAYGLLEREENSRFVMLEARHACSGATGRNGGHTKGASYRSFLANEKSLGLDEAIRIARLEYDNIKAVHAFSRVHSIDCDLFSGDTVDIIYDQSQWDEAIKSISLMQKTMPQDLHAAAQYTFHTAREAMDTFHCKGDKPLGAISYQAGSLSAYKLVIGMLKLCLARGLNLQTNTPATALHKKGDGSWMVETERGIINTKRIVLATNGYTGFLYPKLRSIIVPLRGQITAHRPGSNMSEEGLQTTYSFIYANGYEYMIPRPRGSTFAGDIVIGGGLSKALEEGINEYGTTDDTTIEPIVSEYLTATTPRYFGSSWGNDHPDGRIRKEWTGIMGYSPDGFPLIGEIPGEAGLWISASFQGHGMVLTFLCARALVEMMNGGDGKELDVWFPKVFRITGERMQRKFQGKLHVKPQTLDLEVKANI